MNTNYVLIIFCGLVTTCSVATAQVAPACFEIPIKKQEFSLRRVITYRQEGIMMKH